MSLCINPSCPRPDNPENTHNRFCQSCGSDLLLLNRYQVTRLLSDNTGFSKVYEAYESETPKILKVLKANLNAYSAAGEQFKQEAAVLGQLNHPGIPNVDGYFTIQTRNGLLLHCMAIEQISGNNLETWLLNWQENRPISQEVALSWLKQLAETLHLLHTQQYYHWNIKPSNIILSTSYQQDATTEQPHQDLVLIDFGTARELTYIYLWQLGAENQIRAVVTPGYTSPEQANGQPVPQSDFFALGRTFVFLLTGQQPLNFYDAHNDVLNWRSAAPGISPLLADFIDWLMARLPDERPRDTLVILQRLEEIDRSLNNVPLLLLPFWVIAELVSELWEGLTSFRPLAWLDSITTSALRVVLAIFLIVLIPAILAALTPKAMCAMHITSPSCPQAPKQIADIDYFPPETGTDSKGRTAEFEVAVLSREYEWKLGSSYEIQSAGQIINVNDLITRLQQEGIQNRLGNSTDIISVGTASCEGDLQTEEIRALERAKSIQILAKTLFGNTPAIKDYHLLNLGKFKNCSSNSNPSLTSYQRSIIIVGVTKKTPGVILDEALSDRLSSKPFGDFKIEDYSLGTPDKFKLTY